MMDKSESGHKNKEDLFIKLMFTYNKNLKISLCKIKMNNTREDQLISHMIIDT